MRYLIMITALVASVISASVVKAYYLATPHNESNGIYCYTCHQMPEMKLSLAEWAARTLLDPDDTMKNAVCNACHGSASVNPLKGPAKVAHASSTMAASTNIWTTECTQCHDVHFQAQLVTWKNAGDRSKMYLVTSNFMTANGARTYVDPNPLVEGDDYTTIGFDTNPTYFKYQPGFGNPVTWKAKGGNMAATRAVDGSRGLILVPNKGTPTETFEIIDATANVIKVKGRMAKDVGNGGSFAIIYGQSIKAKVMPNGGLTENDLRDVKFFLPNVLAGTFGGFVDETAGTTMPVGLCQVCHTTTVSWRGDGGAATHYANSDCDSCHNILTGGGAVIVNSVPVANAGPDQSVATGSLVTLNDSGSSDADGDPLTYSWSFTSRPIGSSAVLSGASTAGPVFTADVAGTYVVSLVVKDGKVNSGADQVTINVLTPNSPPIANAGPDQNVSTGSQVTLNGSGSIDAESDPLTYSWLFTSRPVSSNAGLAGANTASPSFMADVAGVYVVSLVVNDGKVDSGADAVNITVSPPPTISVSANPAAFFVDSGQNSARISWIATNAVHIYLQRINSGQPEFEVFGNYYDAAAINATTTFTVRAVSASGASATATLAVKVLDLGTLGIAITNPLARETILRPFVNVEGLVSDGGAEVGATVNGIPAQVAFNRFFVNNLALAEGENTITAVVTNASGATDTHSITVNCNTTSQEWLELSLNPESGVADANAIPAQPFTATLKVTPHLAGSLKNWSWSLGYGYLGYGTNPNPMTIDNATNAYELPLAFSEPGVYTLNYTLYDNDSGRSYLGKIMVNVRSAAEFDTFLKDKWNSVKNAFASRNIDEGLTYFLESTKERYRVALTAIDANAPGQLLAMFGNVPDIQQVYAWENRVKYRVHRVHDIGGVPVTASYYIYFVRDLDEIWRIEQF